MKKGDKKNRYVSCILPYSTKYCILKAGVINEEIAVYVQAVAEELKKLYPVKREGVEMLISHLAMAYQRAREEKEVEELSEQLWEELQGCSRYQEAERLCRQLLKEGPYILAQSEKQYVLLHLCNLLQQEDEKQ